MALLQILQEAFKLIMVDKFPHGTILKLTVQQKLMLANQILPSNRPIKQMELTTYLRLALMVLINI